MKLKLISDINFKIGLIDFNGESITEFIFHKDITKILGGAMERYAIWQLPFEEKMARMFGHERVWDFRDFPNMPYIPTVILNQFEIELSSFIVSIEKLSLCALEQNPNLTPLDLYFLQTNFLKSFGEKFLCNTNHVDFSSSQAPKIIDLTSIDTSRIKEVNSLIKKGSYFRCPGTCFAISAEYIFIKGLNEDECEYNEIKLVSLLECALLEVRQAYDLDTQISNLLSAKPREIKSELILTFLNRQKKVRYDILSNKLIKDLNTEIRIGYFLFNPSL